MKLEVLE